MPRRQAESHSGPHRWPRVTILIQSAWIYLAVSWLLPGPVEVLQTDYRADATSGWSARAAGHYEYLKRHFEEPFEGYGHLDTLVPQFRAVFLSHAACGFYNVSLDQPSRSAEVDLLLEEITTRALSPKVSPYGQDPRAVESLGDHNLYLSHLGLILGLRRLATGDDFYDPLHERLIRHLRERSLAEGDFHARSFPDSPKFPADQSVTLLALHLFDRCFESDLASEPLTGWQRILDESLTDPVTGLPRSCLDDDYPGALQPRGCALSWTVLYLSQCAPAEAAALYDRYREQLFDTVLGCGGFREWPRHHSGHLDFDTGPILLGLGFAASGLGLGAARIQGDATAYAAIQQSAATVGLLSVSGDERSYRLSPLLGEAILFHGTTARPWFEEPRRRSSESPAPPATGAMIVIAFASLVLFRAGYRITRCLWLRS